MQQTTGLDLEVEEGRAIELEVGGIGLENPNSDRDFLGINLRVFQYIAFYYTSVCLSNHPESEEVFKHACGPRVHVKIQLFIVRVKVEHDAPNRAGSIVGSIPAHVGESCLQRNMYFQKEQLPTLTLMLLEEKNGMGGSWLASGSMAACPATPQPVGWVAGA